MWSIEYSLGGVIKTAVLSYGGVKYRRFIGIRRDALIKRAESFREAVEKIERNYDGPAH